MLEDNFNAWLQGQTGFDLSQIRDNGYSLVTDLELKAKINFLKFKKNHLKVQFVNLRFKYFPNFSIFSN